MTGGYLTQLVTVILATSLGVFGAFLIVKVAGKEFFALAAVAATGGYAFAALHITVSLPAVPAAALALAAAAVLGVVLFLILDILDEQEVVSISLAIQLGTQSLFDAWIPVTGGPSGIGGFGIPAPNALALNGVAVIGLIGIYVWLVRSGRLAAAFLTHAVPREAATFGLNVQRHRATTIIFASVLLGLFGLLQTLSVGYVGPSSFTLSVSILLYLCVALGGSNLRLAPCILAALLLILAPEAFRFIGLDSVQAALLREMAMGIILMLLGVVAARRRVIRLTTHQ